MQPAAPGSSLPRPNTAFIGRESDIARLVEMLGRDDYRLLTLTGPGGIGKTRLAIELAHQLDFADGVYFVPLQPLRSADNLVTTIVNALPLRFPSNADPLPLLLNYLRDKRLMLILDNFEHLLEGVEVVTDIISAATQVKLLVTSRERLNLQAEQVWPVSGLAVPDNGTADAFDHYSAVQLFVERAQRAQPDFSLDDQQDTVISICQMVDGLPLALELAASWTRALSCAVITDKIQRNIDILTTNQRDMPQRHQSMRAVFDHSWHLLTDEERATFPKLSVFRGGFTADAAQQVAGATLETLVALIDKSLIRVDDVGRYHLHELVRQYAEERLEAAGEIDVTLNAHCEYYSRLLHECEADLKGQQQIEALNIIEADFENVRAAWQRAIQSHDRPLVDASMDSLFLFCTLRSRFQDHQALFGQARTEFAPRGNDEPTATWGRILVRSYRFFITNYAESRSDAIADSKISLGIARSHDDQSEMAFCLYLLGRLTMLENPAQALLWLKESLQHYAAIGEIFYSAYLLQAIFHCHHYLGQNEQAIAAMHASLALCRAYNLRSPLGIVLTMTGFAEVFVNGNFIEGERYMREAISLHRSVNSRGEIARQIRWLSAVVFVRGDFDQARRLAEESRDIVRDLHDLQYLSVSSAILGMVANMQGDYRRGEALGRESLHYAVAPIDLFFTGWSLACACCGLGDLQAASEYLYLALQHAHNDICQPGLTTLCAPIAAFIYSRTGNPERSAELLALAFTHPKSPSGWLEKWSLMAQLQADLKNTLGEDTYQAMWQRGQTQDLEQVFLALMQDFQPDRDNRVERANQALPNPLTPRELEVLLLLIEGLSNPQIGERLFISTGTVKSHTNKIYSKLAVDDRLQATHRAQELNLI